MNSYQLVEQLAAVQQMIDNSTNLMGVVQEMSSYEQKLNQLSINIALSQGDSNQVITYKNTYFSEINLAVTFLQQTEIGKVFEELLHLKRLLGSIQEKFVDKAFITQLDNRFSEFKEKFQLSIQGYQYPSILSLTDFSSRFLLDLESFSRFSQMALTDLIPIGDYDSTSLSRLSIFLDSEQTYTKVITNLRAIQQLYSEICQLLGISEVDFPLKIIKVETGSFQIDVLGCSQVIEFLRDLIRDGINFMYRNYTREGRIAAIPKKTEAIEGILQLQQKLHSAGIDTTAMKDELQKSSATIARELSELLAGETNIKLDQEKFHLSAEIEKQVLSQRNQALLSGSEIEDS